MLATLTAMEGETISRLAEALRIERTTLTRSLTPLQKLGYVLIEQGPDKRARSLGLTRVGKRALAAAKPRWHAAQLRLEKQLGKAEVNLRNATLDHTLDRLPNS